MNYDASQVGVPYVRATRIEINWADGLAPKTATVEQSLAVKLADGTVRNLDKLQTFVAPLNFNDDPLPLINPETGEALGADTTTNNVMLGVLAMVRAEQVKRNG